jgi:hypothetical protein
MYRSPKYRTIALRGDNWTLEGVTVLTTPSERYIGVGHGRGSPVMLLTRSIHTFTVLSPISVIVVDLHGSVLQSTVMVPGRIFWFGSTRWVVEAKLGVALPSPGSEIVASTMRSGCPEH